MNKRKIKKRGYELIVKSNQSHTVAFESMKSTTSDLKELADIISAIPSSGKQKETVILRSVFVGLLLILALLRTVAVLTTFLSGNMDVPITTLILLIGLFVPALGIIAVFRRQVEYYYLTGILLVLSLSRSLRAKYFEGDYTIWFVIGLMILTVALAFFIPSKLRTPYTTSVVHTDDNGEYRNVTEYHFKDTRLKREGILDDLV
jgi:hypothetical protein